MWLARLSSELERPHDALRYFDSLWRHIGDPYSAFEVARLQERSGNNVEAIEAYEYSLAAWQDADAELRPRVEAARRAITRLSGAND